MTPHTRSLLPSLPPELRNEIYHHLSTCSSNTSYNTGLPLALKTYTDKQTTLSLIPVHTGSLALLSLRDYGFQEAFEYASYLTVHALEMKVGITFNGRVGTFDTLSWGKKIRARLSKLAKQYPWLTKVGRYDVRVVWDPLDSSFVPSRGKPRRSTGKMVNEMLSTVTSFLDQKLKGKKGSLKVGLDLEHRWGIGNVVSDSRIGLAEFFGEEEGWKEVEKSVRLLPLKTASGEILLEVDAGVVRWVGEGEGELVMRRRVERGKGIEISVGSLGAFGVEFVVAKLVEECLGRR